ncbi:MAG: hypothetical protein AB1801_16915 [Chloroflexota bacterium]
MTAKLKVDLTQGILEVEGSEVFVKAIYQDFKLQFLGDEVAGAEERPAARRRRRQKARLVIETVPEPVVQPVPAPEPAELPPKVKAVPPPPPYNFLKELDLTATADHPALVEFMDSKLPITNEERNLVFLYYLQHVINQPSITPDHVYTCYRKANIRAPLNLENSLHTTAEHHGWIKIAKNGHLTVTADGKRYAEKDLPKRVKS